MRSRGVIRRGVRLSSRQPDCLRYSGTTRNFSGAGSFRLRRVHSSAAAFIPEQLSTYRLPPRLSQRISRSISRRHVYPSVLLDPSAAATVILANLETRQRPLCSSQQNSRLNGRRRVYPDAARDTLHNILFIQRATRQVA